MDNVRLSWNAVRWFALAVISLAVAGLLALVLVSASVPVVARTLAMDPVLAQRSLVVHVNLATGVWFFACIAGLSCMASPRAERRHPLPVTLATAGAIAFTAATLLPAQVVLSDYVPVIDHWLFFAGLAAFGVGVAIELVRRFRAPNDPHLLPPEVQHGTRAAALAFVIALVTIAAAYVVRDPAASRLAGFQHLFWGGGHVLQFVATAGMLAAWLLLLHQITGTSAITPRFAAVLFAVLIAPTVLAPWLATAGSPRAFTTMMELGIFPVVLVMIGAGIAAIRRHGRANGTHWPAQPLAMIGLAVSVVMTLIGFGLGAAITGDTTLTPAHYHISIGAVTVTFMTALVVLLSRAGAPIRHPRIAMWQPLIYGGGQTVFALGLAIAGFWGQAGRKVYGAEQVVAAPAERIGWIIAGTGGLLALVGGIGFIAIVAGCTHDRRRGRLASLATLGRHPAART